MKSIKDKPGEWYMAVLSAILSLGALLLYISHNNKSGIIVAITLLVCSLAMIFSADNLES